MKPRFSATLALVPLPGPAFALTDDELSPAALAAPPAFAIESGTADSSGTRSYDGCTGGHAYTINPFITGQGPSTLTVWISKAPPYYIDFDATGNKVRFGSFTIGGAPLKVPEISVTAPNGDPLEDAVGRTKFGTVKTGQSGAARKFTIGNTGKGFIITGPGANRPAPGKSTSFTASFKPTSTGTKNAVVKIAGNDAGEGPFDIKAAGGGAG